MADITKEYNGNLALCCSIAEGSEKIKKILKSANYQGSFHIQILHIFELQEWKNYNKIFIILREPSARSFNLWKIMLREGFEWIDDFELALSAEPRRFFSAEQKKLYRPIYDYLYIKSSMHFENIKKIIDVFGKKNFSDPEKTKIVVAEEMSKDEEIKEKIIEFLTPDGKDREIKNLKRKIKLKIKDIKPEYNVIPFNSKAQYILRAIEEEMKKAKLNQQEILPIKILREINLMVGKKVQNHWCIEFLKHIFRKEVERISEILRKDLITLWGYK
ncbi:hypothetical protein HRbin19_00183 [bacterium HR19]|nr:hypothetical protein HRbin19_00183 [bacterium HR19]